jgi:outer membrane protein assembly factor BamB
MRRFLPLAGLVLVLGIAAFALYRHWKLGSGHFAYAPNRTPDQQLPEQTPRPGANLSVTNADDFPEFLGPGRHAAVEHVALDPDWAAHPPRLRWRQPVGAAWSAFSVVNGFAVTMEQRGREEQVTCCALATGAHRWTAAWETRFTIMGVGPRSTPTIAGGRVYALGAWGHLACLDGRDGRIIWERELMTELGIDWMAEDRAVHFGRAASPLVTDGLAIVPGGGTRGARASLLAFDAASGEPRWRGGTRQASYSSPVLAELLGERQVLIVSEDAVSGHALDTGRELWSYPWPSNSGSDASVAQPVVLPGNRVLLTKGYHDGAVLIELLRPVPGGEIEVRRVWRQRGVLNTKFTNVAIWQGHAYALSDGVLACVDLATGEPRWREGKYGHGQLLRVRDLLLVLSEDGELVLVRADPQTPNAVCGRVQALTGTTWNNLALYGRFLLVRNATTAACYELALCPPEPVPGGGR